MEQWWLAWFIPRKSGVRFAVPQPVACFEERWPNWQGTSLENWRGPRAVGVRVPVSPPMLPDPAPSLNGRAPGFGPGDGRSIRPGAAPPVALRVRWPPFQGGGDSSSLSRGTSRRTIIGTTPRRGARSPRRVVNPKTAGSSPAEAATFMKKGSHHTPVARQKLSEWRMGKRFGPRSAETRAKIGAANKGRSFTPEQRENMARGRRGCFISVEGRAKLSLAQKRSVKTSAHILKLAERNTGRIVSEETREKLRVNGTGRLHTAESKAKMRAASLTNGSGLRGMLAKKHVQYVDRYGAVHLMASGWEARFASALDAVGLIWLYEPAVFRLADGRSYYPDFWVAEWVSYVELKGQKWDNGKASRAVSEGRPVRIIYGRKEFLAAVKWLLSQKVLA